MDIRLATEPEIRAELGARFATLRLEKSLSQAELAKKAGIGIATLQRFEQGNGATLSTFIQILMALGRIDDLSFLLSPAKLTIKALETQSRSKNRRRISKKNHNP